MVALAYVPKQIQLQTDQPLHHEVAGGGGDRGMKAGVVLPAAAGDPRGLQQRLTIGTLRHLSGRQPGHLDLQHFP